MKELVLKRIAHNDKGVFGVLVWDNTPFALTAERPDLNNQSNVSCIPTGSYACKKTVSHHFGECIHILNVPDRSHILFHKGNIPAQDSEGCILVGEQFEPLSGKEAVTSSKKGFNELMATVPDEFRLVIHT